MAYVKTLDLAYLSRDHGHPLASGYPDILFPSASSVRLSGVFSYSLAASILAHTPAKLKHLTWDNVQQTGMQRDLRTDNEFLYHTVNPRQPYHQQALRPWNNRAASQTHGYFDRRGPMHNLLGSLAGRCPNLESLILRKVGENCPGPGGRRDFGREFSIKDEDLYAEWVELLNSVKGTLRHLVLEQGQRTFDPPLTINGRPILRPMDQRFGIMILPVLTDGQWPVLRNFNINGVKALPFQNPWADATRTVQDMVGEGRSFI